MPRSPLSVVVPDASLFAKALGQSLKTRHADGQPPRPATEPKGSKDSSNSGETETDPATGEPN